PASLLTTVNLSYPSRTSQQTPQTNQTQNHPIPFPNTKNPKNLIFILPHPIPPSFNTPYPYYKNNPPPNKITPTPFHKYLKPTNPTYSNHPKQNLTHSAPPATAFTTRHKTYNPPITVHTNKKPIKSLLQQPKQQPKS
ncbi:alkaline phosphatase, partial [Staphylococcus epidermidis]|uniref:alkaline phosphatase n=1 Tax=Staphylococcus epidermidis TaxID=1282 RepID=UPI0016429574